MKVPTGEKVYREATPAEKLKLVARQFVNEAATGRLRPDLDYKVSPLDVTAAAPVVFEDGSAIRATLTLTIEQTKDAD